MKTRMGLIALAGLLTATPGVALDPVPQSSEAGGYKLQDVLVSSFHDGRAVGTTRTDSRGAFRLEFPAVPGPGDQICFSGPSVRAAIDHVRYGDDNETLLRRGGGALSRRGAGDQQRLEPLVELLVVIALNGQPQGGEQRLVVPGARIRAGQARSADQDLCYRPFAEFADSQGQGGERRSSGRGASGDQSLAGSGGPVQAATSEPVYVRNADGTYSILELMRTNPASGDASSRGPGRQAGGTVTGRVTSAEGGPEASQARRGGVPEILGDQRGVQSQELRASTLGGPPVGQSSISDGGRRDGASGSGPGVDPRIPPPAARSGPAAPSQSRSTVVTGTITLAAGR